MIKNPVIRMRTIALLFIAFTLPACVRVQPYERVHHAQPIMDTGHERAETQFRAHVHDVREGATGGYGSSGGGCGCN